MNICMFTKGLTVHITGGMETHVESLVDGLVKRRHKVIVITTKHLKTSRNKKKETYYVGDSR